MNDAHTTGEIIWPFVIIAVALWLIADLIRTWSGR